MTLSNPTQTPWDNLYGKDGWCEADEPKFKCPCMYEGFGGELCDQVSDRGGHSGTDCEWQHLGGIAPPRCALMAPSR